ncbi:MAG: hypothetical protein HQ519_13915 [Planctomycetes bacterium]|nr:hypothetical protein [Planctomycetota bacterium]
MTHKGHYAIAAAILLLGIAIVFRPGGAAKPDDFDAARYQLVSHGESIFVIDTVTGKTWQKYYKSDQGPTVWDERQPPWK